MTTEQKNEATSLAKIDYDVTEEALSQIEEQWGTIPDCEDKHGYELVRVGLGEMVSLRNRVDDKRKELGRAYKARINGRAEEILSRIAPIEKKLRDAKAKIDNRKKEEKAEKQRIEKERVESLKSRIREIEKMAMVEYGTPIDDIESRLLSLEETEVSKDDFQEFFAEAHALREASMSSLKTIIASERTRIEAEKEAAAERARIEEQQKAERERLEKERAEQDRILAERQKKIEEEREAFEAEKRTREAAERKEREEREAKENEAREAREAEEAAKRKAEQNKRRIAYENEQKKLAEERAKIEADRAKVEAEKEKQRLAAEEEERKRVAEEERKKNEEMQEAMKEEALTVLNDMDTDNELLPEAVLDAIIAGKIPNVKWVG